MTIDAIDPYYRVVVLIGDVAFWVIEKGTPADYGPIDGLKIGWKYPENAAWPTQPEIPYCNFGVIVANASHFEGVDIGTEVAIAVYHVPGGTPLPAGYADNDGLGSWIPIASFGGRIVELNAEPHPLGMIYRLSCLDYLVDTAEYQISADDETGWPAEAIEDRLTRLTDQAISVFGSVPWGAFAGPEAGWGVFHAKPTPELKGVLDHMVEFLSQYVYFGHLDPPLQGGARGVLVPNNAPELYTADDGLAPDPAQRFTVAWVFRKLFGRGMHLWHPARFRPTGTGGKWRPDVDPADTVNFVDATFNPTGAAVPAEAYGILPADYVEFDADWSRTKKARAERVHVETTIDFVDLAGKAVARTVTQQGYSYTSFPPPVLTVQTDLGYAAEARTLGDFLLGEPLNALGRWEVQKFRLLADQIPDRVNRANSNSWFHPATFTGNALRVIAGIPAHQNPNPGSADWYAGIITSAEFNLVGGRYWIDFTLSREMPRQATSTTEPNAPYLSLASMKLNVAQAAVTLLQLDPGYTLYDYRIARKG